MVYLFNRRALDRVARPWYARLHSRILELIFGRDTPIHILVELTGEYLFLDFWRGCTRIKALTRMPLPATMFYVVPVARPDYGPWQRQERLEVFWTILDLMRLLPDSARVVNCVQVTAQLLGIQERLRTPSDLVRALEARE